MKVVLTKDAPGVGKKHQVKTVKRGFFLNYLLPRGFAIYGNPGRVKEAEKIMKNRKEKLQFAEAHAEELRDKISAITLTFVRKVSAQNRLFGSISEKDIASALAHQGVAIERDHVHMKSHIKTLGDHKVIIHLREDMDVELNVKVEPEAA